LTTDNRSTSIFGTGIFRHKLCGDEKLPDDRNASFYCKHIRQEWNECVILYEKYEATIASECGAGICEVDVARNDTVDELMT